MKSKDILPPIPTKQVDAAKALVGLPPRQVTPQAIGTGKSLHDFSNPRSNYDTQSVDKRTHISDAANIAIGRANAALNNPYYSSPLKKGSTRALGVNNVTIDDDARSVSSIVSRELDDILNSKLQQDELDEMQIYTLEQQLKDVKEELNQAKFKYEKRQLYELT